MRILSHALETTDCSQSIAGCVLRQQSTLRTSKGSIQSEVHLILYKSPFRIRNEQHWLAGECLTQALAKAEMVYVSWILTNADPASLKDST